MKLLMDGVEYLPAAAAAEQLATTETRILMLLKRKALCGELIDGSWFVTAASLVGCAPHSPEQDNRPECRTSCGGSACGCR